MAQKVTLFVLCLLVLTQHPNWFRPGESIPEFFGKRGGLGDLELRFRGSIFGVSLIRTGTWNSKYTYSEECGEECDQSESFESTQSQQELEESLSSGSMNQLALDALYIHSMVEQYTDTYLRAFTGDNLSKLLDSLLDLLLKEYYSLTSSIEEKNERLESYYEERDHFEEEIKKIEEEYAENIEMKVQSVTKYSKSAKRVLSILLENKRNRFREVSRSIYKEGSCSFSQQLVRGVNYYEEVKGFLRSLFVISHCTVELMQSTPLCKFIYRLYFEFSQRIQLLRENIPGTSEYSQYEDYSDDENALKCTRMTRKKKRSKRISKRRRKVIVKKNRAIIRGPESKRRKINKRFKSLFVRRVYKK
ncbi:E3 ubiquitin-protein ligase TOM1-like protein [Cryptosporidium felis]|nr:E3 ubiquitin-protein ligase TOM1-like protein [Cryptosporidium felis]